MGNKQTEKKRWVLRLNGRETEIRAEWGEDFGTVMVDGREMERWHNRLDHMQVRRSLRLGEHRVLLHLTRETEYESFTADLSVDGISVTTGRPVAELTATPVSVIDKVWQIRLEDEEHEVRLEHRGGSEIHLSLDGLPVEKSVVHDRHSDHLIRVGRHEVWVHIRRVGEWEHRYDLSVGGVFQDALEPAGPFTPTPLDLLLYRAWEVERDGRKHRVELRVSSLGGKRQVWLDGALVAETGRFFKRWEDVIPFRIGEAECALHLRETEDFRVLFDLVVDGFSLTTGARLQVMEPDPQPAEDEAGKPDGPVRSWTVQVSGNSHEIAVHSDWKQVRIFLDGRELYRRTWLHAVLEFISYQPDFIWFPLLVGGEGSGVLLEKRLGRRFRLYVDGRDADTGGRLDSLHAMLPDRKTWLWMFKGPDGRLQRVEVTAENWFRSRITVNGEPAGEFYWWKERMRTVPLGALQVRLTARRQGWGDSPRYVLTVQNQEVWTGRKIDFSKTPADPLAKPPFWDRFGRFLAVYALLAVGLLMLDGWTGEFRDWLYYLVFPALFTLPRLFGIESLRGWTLFYLTAVLLVFGGGLAWSKWLQPLLAGW
jgi:hypothetical protein